MPTALRVARAGEWWEHKLAPVLGTGYAAALAGRTHVVHVAGPLAVALLALVPGALYVSVLNDLTDRDVDRRAGKPNRLADRPAGRWWAVVAATVATGAAIACIAWWHRGAALAVYAGAWIAFALYSVPPVRLKSRGAAGAVADAAGAELFPHLLAVAVVLHAASSPFARAFTAAVGVWALAHGLRGAIWHQLRDADADALSGVVTFGRAHPAAARMLGTRLLFPLELGAFAALLALAHEPLLVLLLPLWAVVELRRARRWGGAVVVVRPAPGPKYRIAMNELYVGMYPLALLVVGSVHDPRTLAVLAVHVALFPRTLARVAADLYNELRHPRLPSAVRG